MTIASPATTSVAGTGDHFRAVGVWLFTINLTASRFDALPRPLAYAGVALALAYWVVLNAGVLQLVVLIPLLALLFGIILAPAWYIGVGLWLRRAG